MLSHLKTALTLATSVALGFALAACSGGSNAVPSASGVSGMAGAGSVTSQSATKPVLVAADGHKGGDGDGGDGSGGDGAATYTYVTSLSGDGSLNLSNFFKSCDATPADAPLFTPTVDTTTAVPKGFQINDCITTDNLNAPSAPTNPPLYIVVVDTGKGGATTEIGGTSNLSFGVWDFTGEGTSFTFQANHSYAFFVATKSSDDNDRHRCHRDKHWRNDDQDKWRDGDSDHHRCHRDHDKWDDNGWRDGGDDGHDR